MLKRRIALPIIDIPHELKMTAETLDLVKISAQLVEKGTIGRNDLLGVLALSRYRMEKFIVLLEGMQGEEQITERKNAVCPGRSNNIVKLDDFRRCQLNLR